MKGLHCTSIMDRLDEVHKKLPKGHVEILKAHIRLEEEYNNSHAVERFWSPKLPRKTFNSLKEIKIFISAICQEVGQPDIKEIVLSSKDVHIRAGGHYDPSTKAIHFPYEVRCVSTTSLIHELTHHCTYPVAPTHGKEFCEILDFLFSVTYQILTGKKPKPDWEGKWKQYVKPVKLNSGFLF